MGPSGTGPSGAAGQLFRRIGRSGWLVLAGSVPSLAGSSAWMDRLLPRMDLGRAVVWLAADPEGPQPTKFLEDIEDLLGAPVDRQSPAEDGWEAAGLLLITDPSPVSMVPALRTRLLTCLEGGGIVMAVGEPAAGFGEAIHSPLGGAPGEGLRWLPGSVVLPEEEALPDDGWRTWLQSPEKRFAIRLPADSMLALGPAGEVEAWGGAQPGVILGSAWRHA
jgi:hypothetical protein